MSLVVCFVAGGMVLRILQMAFELYRLQSRAETQ